MSHLILYHDRGHGVFGPCSVCMMQMMEVPQNLWLWVNGNATFYETFNERNNKEISAYLFDKQTECCTFKINQHHSITE